MLVRGYHNPLKGGPFNLKFGSLKLKDPQFGVNLIGDHLRYTNSHLSVNNLSSVGIKLAILAMWLKQLNGGGISKTTWPANNLGKIRSYSKCSFQYIFQDHTTADCWVQYMGLQINYIRIIFAAYLRRQDQKSENHIFFSALKCHCYPEPHQDGGWYPRISKICFHNRNQLRGKNHYLSDGSPSFSIGYLSLTRECLN